MQLSHLYLKSTSYIKFVYQDLFKSYLDIIPIICDIHINILLFSNKYSGNNELYFIIHNIIRQKCLIRDARRYLYIRPRVYIIHFETNNEILFVKEYIIATSVHSIDRICSDNCAT